MRTSVILLVQVIGLIFPAGAVWAAAGDGYGSGENAAPQSSTRDARRATSGTVLDMPSQANASENPTAARPDTPPRGMTKSRVLARYGKPVSQSGPVGQPPISRWDYPDYRLFFEYDHVLHAVVPDHPEPIAHTNELQTDLQ